MQPLQDELQQGITALKAGKKSEAEQILKEVARQNPQDVDAWLWLGASVSTPNETLYCLERVLELEPDNQKARAGVEWAGTQIGEGQPGAVDPLSSARQEVQDIGLSERPPASLSDGTGPSENGAHAQRDPEDTLVGVLSPPVTADPVAQSTSHFFPNLVIAALVIILLLGILLIVALLRARLG